MKSVKFVKNLKGKDYKVNIEIDEKQKIWNSIYCTTYMEGQKFKKCTIRSTRDGIEVRFKKVTDVECVGQKSAGLIVHEFGVREVLEEIISKMRAIKEYQDQYVLDDKEKAILDADTIEFGYDPYEMRVNLSSTPVAAYIKRYFESHDHLDFKLDHYDLTDRVGRNEDLRAYTIKNGKPSGFYTVADIPADLFEKVVIFELERFLKEIEDEKKAEEEKDRKREEKIKALAQKAKETGKKQVYTHYFVECTDDEEDCDLDLVEILVDEDGKTSKRITHTY